MIASLSKGVFERRASTRSGLFAFWAVVLRRCSGKSSVYETLYSTTNLLALRHDTKKPHFGISG